MNPVQLLADQGNVGIWNNTSVHYDPYRSKWLPDTDASSGIPIRESCSWVGPSFLFLQTRRVRDRTSLKVLTDRGSIPRVPVPYPAIGHPIVDTVATGNTTQPCCYSFCPILSHTGGLQRILNSGQRTPGNCLRTQDGYPVTGWGIRFAHSVQTGLFPMSLRATSCSLFTSTHQTPSSNRAGVSPSHTAHEACREGYRRALLFR